MRKHTSISLVSALYTRDEDGSCLTLALDVETPTELYQVDARCLYVEGLAEDAVRVVDVSTGALRSRLHRVLVRMAEAWIESHQDECCAAAVGAVRAAGEVWRADRRAA